MHWSSSKGSTSILGYTLEPILYERTEKVLVHCHDLYSPKFALENSETPRRDLQVKEVLETSTDPELRNWWFSFIDFILYSILPDDPKDAAAIKRKTLWFYYNTITRTLYHWSYDGILLCGLSHKEAHEALRETHDGTCRAHQPWLKVGIDFEDLATTGQRWFLTLSPMLRGVTPVRFIVTSSIKHQVISIQHLLSYLRCRAWMSLDPSPLQHPKDISSSWL